MSSDNALVQVSRAVADGAGEWADVPRCVREAVAAGLGAPRPPPARPAALTEAALECSVRTFADAAALRDEAVRSFAHFHNRVEATRAGLRQRDRALWRTALQLHPELLGAVRRAARLGADDAIPSGIPIRPADAQRIAELEGRIAEVEACVEATRGASLRLAASFLADDEKRAMGLEPEDLRPEDVEVAGRYTHASLSRDSGRLADGSNLFDDPTLSEIRERYMNRIATINEEKYCGEVQRVLSNRR